MENPAPATAAPGRKILTSKSRITRFPLHPPRKSLTDPPIKPPRKHVTDPPIQRRVFGTNKNPNVPTKPPPGPPPPEKKKPLVRIGKAPIRSNVSQIQPNVKFHQGGKRIPEEKKDDSSSTKKESSSPRTPTVRSSEANLLSSETTTPYYSGEICSKSWIDKLEMSSYWLNQIKLAEAAGKNFVSVAFFRLALESKAEPIESLRDELKQYLVRNESLCSEDHQWRDVSSMYGL